ncbi:hypothetical protein OHB14_43800 [Streptomyces sp. NBC_01613]|uniref:hypothetical protein n=1 Tax=Streptomyces sp. NBC_01613 TaxID=2975896 RepID=UPI00386810ED
MNTDRPDNDAADSAEERDDTGSAAEQGAVEEQGAEGAAAPGVTEGDADAPEAEASEAGTSEAGTSEAGPSEAGASEGEASQGEASGEDAGTEGSGADGEGSEAEESKVAEAPAVGEDDGDVPDATPDPEAEHPRPARRRSPVLIASVAAAVMLVGGGGAYLAASASSGSGGRTNAGASGDDSTPPPLALDGYSEGGTNGIAPGEPNPYGVTYKVDGSLPDGPDSAPVYRVSGEVTKDEVARLAKALGLTGTPVAQGQAWQVGPDKDGSGPSLVVNKQAPGTWTFHRYAAGTDACQSMTACTKDPANPAGDTVGEAAAKKAASPVLKAVGQDDAKVDASQIIGAQRAVNANPLVGGLPTYGWTTGLTVSAQGEVVGGSGQLKAPVKGDTYPVLGAQKTLDLMNSAPTTDHRMGIGGCATPVPQKDRLEAPCGQSAPGASATPAKETVTVEGAVFGLAARAVDGRQALVPSWLFEVKGAGAQNTFTATYPAVDPKYLASNSTGPSAEPTPSATAPSDEPTSAPATRDVKVDGYTADGKELTVSFTGGVCADYEATASENADQVTVTVTEKPWKGKVCIMIAKEIQKTVQLDEPIGDRKVVGSDGKGIPQVKPGARLPRTTAEVQ